MALARSRVIDPTTSLVVHTISRCIGRGRLMADAVRLNWLAGRAEFLASIFAIEVLDFAVLPNHFHLLLRTLPELAWCWTDEEVAERWLTLRSSGPLGAAITEANRPSAEDIAEAVADGPLVDEWRRRLADLGWFHKELKEPCARLWNAEDDRVGPFWQGRYAAKVALNDAAVVSQAIYVLLNRVRAGLEAGVGEDEFTSMGRRMRQLMREVREGRHADASEAFERRVVNGDWMPVFPANPGSAAELPDGEYSRRVANGRRRFAIRLAAREDAEMLLWQATDATVEELEPLVSSVEEADGNGNGRTVRIPRHRHPRRRAEGRAPVDRLLGDSQLPRSLGNPFVVGRSCEGAVSVLPGMTLSALIIQADLEGRHERPDKRHHIAPNAEPAMDRLWRAAHCATGECRPHANKVIDRDEEGLSPAVPACPPTTLPSSVRETVERAVASLKEDLELLRELAEQACSRKSGVPTSPDSGEQPLLRVRWHGSAMGDGERLRSEASRRGSMRVVAVRPVVG